MAIIPKVFIQPLIKLLEWHLTAYPRNPIPPDVSYIRLKRLLENIVSRNYELDNETLYFLKQAAYDVRDSIDECGIDAEQLSKIDEWLSFI